MKANRKEMCEELLNRYWREGESSLENMNVGDESQICHYDSKLKDTSRNKMPHFFPLSKKAKKRKSNW